MFCAHITREKLEEKEEAEKAHIEEEKAALE